MTHHIHCTHCTQSQYPETLGNTIIVNTSLIFPYAWGMVRPWIDPVSARKIHIKSGQGEWGPFLSDLLGAKNVSSSYAGDGMELQVGAQPFAAIVGVNGNSDGNEGSEGNGRGNGSVADDSENSGIDADASRSYADGSGDGTANSTTNQSASAVAPDDVTLTVEEGERGERAGTDESGVDKSEAGGKGGGKGGAAGAGRIGRIGRAGTIQLRMCLEREVNEREAIANEQKTTS
jgi:hypothetical protein